MKTERWKPIRKVSGAVLLGAAGLLSACGAIDATAKQDAKQALEREIRVVGSSTVYPFSAKVAQEFKNRTGQNIVIEATGSGGGHKLLCQGKTGPDVTNSSRPQKASELALCDKNGVEDVIEVRFGRDGIVLANALKSDDLALDPADLYMALAQDVPTSKTDCTLRKNPYKRWSDINPSFPKQKIEVFGPPPTSGTRDAFFETALIPGALSHPCLATLKASDPKAFAQLTRTLREDGAWIDAGENDNAIVQTLTNAPNAVGVLGYAFLDQNRSRIKGATLSGAAPTYENIASGEYPLSRSLYFYLKSSVSGLSPELLNFAEEFTSERAVGPRGYLREIGLIPLPDAEREAVRQKLAAIATDAD